MPVARPGTTASQLARDYVVSLNEFAEETIAVLTRSAVYPVSVGQSVRRREICAAVSAAMISAFDASSLSEGERGAIDQEIRESLLPFWNKYAASDPGAAEFIAWRSSHYLRNRARGSQVKTAVLIVESLLEALEIPKEKIGLLTRELTPAFAHRMVGDLYRINDASSRIGIELTLVAAISVMLGITASYESVLRLLRVA
ncbi:MAG: hypothetical protein ABI821_00235 [Pseudomonadota bacterium]